MAKLVMQNSSIRKALGKRIKQLRKDNNWTQKELAIQIESSHAQLNKYESGQNTPPLDKLMMLADVLNTSVDYLLGGHNENELPVYNNRLIQRFQTIEHFEHEEREIVITLLDAMIAKHNMETTLKSMNN